MITYVQGDLFATGADALINTVNCEGYMSKGIAYQFKQRYPQNDRIYKDACTAGEMYIGTVLCHREDDVTIINFPTKDRWRQRSQMAYIEKGLDALVRELPRLQVKSVAIPPLGCGNGGLSWGDVKALLEKKLSPLADYRFIVCQPGQGVSRTNAEESSNPTAKGLLLLKLEELLQDFNMTRLMCACALVNYYYGHELFSFNAWKDGVKSTAIANEARRLKNYKRQHGMTSKEAYEAIYIRVCSKRTDGIIHRTQEAIEKAAAFVNSMAEDSVLLTATAILTILSEDAKTYLPGKNEKLSRMLGSRAPEDEAAAVQKLLEANIAEMDLCGELHLIKRNEKGNTKA